MEKPRSKIDLIQECLESSEIELFPSQIAQKLRLNISTVKTYLRRLAAEGKVIQPYRGAYCNRVTYGVMFVPIRVHNVILSLDGAWLGELKVPDVVEFTGDVKVGLLFGCERRKVTFRLSCDAGMDRRALLFALHRGYDLYERYSKQPVRDIVVSTFEMNRDFHGVRLDRVVGTYTRQCFEEFLDRVYQKEEDIVRGEMKISREMKVEEVLSLLHGGVPALELTQGVFLLKQSVERLVDAIKFHNQQLQEIKLKIEGLEEKRNAALS